MAKKNILVVKVTQGSSPPTGFIYVRTLRGKDVYIKEINEEIYRAVLIGESIKNKAQSIKMVSLRDV
jgi:hypothetical protein